MNLTDFNKYLIIYQQLTNSFVETPGYYKDGFYKSYQKDYSIVQGENLEILRRFEHLTLMDLYKPEHSENLPFIVEPYRSMNLCAEQEHSYCVYVELGLLIFYYLVDYYRDAIHEFFRILDEMSRNEFIPVHLVDDMIYQIDFDYLKSQESTFFAIENFNRIFALFGESNNGIFYLNNDFKYVVGKYRINNIFEFAQKINFEPFRE
nr:hypothetical protein [Elizabethkingia sp. ASV34]